MSTRNKIAASAFLTVFGQVSVIYSTWMCDLPIRNTGAGFICGIVLLITSGISSAIWTGFKP